MDMQAYYTPLSLAEKAWKKFINKDVTRLLEPSAGDGSLLVPYLRDRDRWRKTVPVDCVEIDMSRHPFLREKGLQVVGIDFMEFNGSSAWSHIIANPPFLNGAKHALKCWELLFEGELVVILNASTVLNQCTAERQMLGRLIELHGSVEYLQDEFMTDETERKTPVQVALVHLVKKSGFEMDFLTGLKVDTMTPSGLATGYQEIRDLAIPEGLIGNAVSCFNAALKAARESIFAQAKANYYSTLLGDTLETLQAKNSNVSVEAKSSSLEFIREKMHAEYAELKNRGWTQILHSSNVTSRLSSKAQQRLIADFEAVKELDFTTTNIYGFLAGLISKQADITNAMICDTFDAIGKHHTGNRAYYKGYKSNDKHRTAAYKIKYSRFIIPGNRDESWRKSVSWDTQQFLNDFDRVFSLLDNRTEPEISLVSLFTQRLDELRNGQRLSSSYFDVRYYGVGTIHFYPRSRKLIDKFNRMVGRLRSWLPAPGEPVSENFWLQFEKADSFDKDVQAEFAKRRNRSKYGYFGSLEQALNSQDDESRHEALTQFDEVMDAVLLKNGIDPTALLESGPKQAILPVQAALPLLVAA